MTNKPLLTAIACAIAGTFAVSCQDIADDDHYAAPSWLKGNAYEVMQGDGNYTSFLKAIDLTGYKPIVNGQSILTVMASDDQAWADYLSQQGFDNVEEMWKQNPVELKKTVGFQLMYYAYDWQKLVNFRPNEGDGATAEAKEQGAGTWYKHRTRSQDDMEQVRGKLDGQDTTVTLYHYERFLPVLSNKLFQTLGIDAKTNYEYFFPSSQWSVSGDGFQISNASVKTQQPVVTDNGYLYPVSQVVRPLETIYQALRQRQDYTDFIGLYDTYASLTPAATETSDNVGKPVYQLIHAPLPNIACEWPVSNFRQMSLLSSVGYTIFAPSNQAISNYFQTYWTPESGYTSLKELDPLVAQYFIMQSFADGNTIRYPEEITKGLVQTAFGTPITINPSQVDLRLICENGVVYGMNQMEPPAVFRSVVGQAFRDTTFQCFLYTLDKSNLVLSLASDKTNFMVLMPTNKQFIQNEPQMRLNQTTQGKNIEVYSDVDGAFANMGQGKAESIVNMHVSQSHVAFGALPTQVYETNVAFNYWFVHDGKITTNARFNQQLNPAYQGSPFVEYHPLTSHPSPLTPHLSSTNGMAYTYDSDDLFAEQTGDGLEHLLSVGNDKNYEYYLFAQLLQKAGLVNGGAMPSLTSQGNRLVVFVPTNEAIKQNVTNIPGCSALKIADDYSLTGNVTGNNKTALANYLRRYFVSSLMNTITSYPYPGSTMKGTFLTMSGEKLVIANDGLTPQDSGTLSVGIEGQPRVPVSRKYLCLPFAFTDGCMHFIDGILTGETLN
ncbi:MAG: hypothetical protein II826_10525 [Prevotella sp.]|nr:hypothetical protein [Prevotella sp.]